MKTKIIYISGNELFEIADIRSAFEEVRAALSLGPDTVLFGVPVDNDDALSVSHPTPEVIEPTPEPVVDIAPNIDEPVEEPLEEQPLPRRARKSAKVVPISDSNVQDSTEPTSDEENHSEESTVIPILSVLGSETNTDETVEPVETPAPESEPINTIDETNVETESVTIEDMIADEAPAEEHEKTLEELLESMAPLGEDTENTDLATPETDNEESVKQKSDAQPETDIDITLEKLATEFVENQDKIGTVEKPATRGKIGKLKNILPFKKAKHEDSSLMGDLFGWAGVAANDEDFTIPGFFK